MNPPIFSRTVPEISHFFIFDRSRFTSLSMVWKHSSYDVRAAVTKSFALLLPCSCHALAMLLLDLSFCSCTLHSFTFRSCTSAFLLSYTLACSHNPLSHPLLLTKQKKRKSVLWVFEAHFSNSNNYIYMERDAQLSSIKVVKLSNSDPRIRLGISIYLYKVIYFQGCIAMSFPTNLKVLEKLSLSGDRTWDLWVTSLLVYHSNKKERCELKILPKMHDNGNFQINVVDQCNTAIYISIKKKMWKFF